MYDGGFLEAGSADYSSTLVGARALNTGATVNFQSLDLEYCSRHQNPIEESGGEGGPGGGGAGPGDPDDGVPEYPYNSFTERITISRHPTD